MSQRLIPLLFALCACGASRPEVNEATRVSIERLYPLRVGSVWTYDVDTGQGLPILAITRVTANDGTRVEVSSGSDPIRYEIKPEGLFRTDRGGYLLKAPFDKGRQWDAGGGATAEITKVSLDVETAAGAFTSCVEVSESGAAGGKIVRTIYCPDVGPVEVESSMFMDLSKQTARVVAKLRGYDFSGALVEP